MEITCTAFRAYQKNTLQGFATLVYQGLVLKECACHLKNNEKWVSFPSREYQKDGERKFAPLIEFDASTDRQAFQSAATAAVDRYVDSQRAA